MSQERIAIFQVHISPVLIVVRSVLGFVLGDQSTFNSFPLPCRKSRATDDVTSNSLSDNNGLADARYLSIVSSNAGIGIFGKES